MPWNKSQQAIDRVREEYARFKEAYAAHQEELKQMQMPMRENEQSVHEITHERYAAEGRAELIKIIARQDAERLAQQEGV